MNKPAIALVILFLGLAVTAAAEEPAHVTVQHILIAFQGSIPEAKVTRTQAEAEALAAEIFELGRRRARTSEPWSSSSPMTSSRASTRCRISTSPPTRPNRSTLGPRWSNPSGT